MASWMVHLRVADKLLDKIPNLCPVEFIMGNMAPDSGAVTPTGFYPDQTVSHFRLDDGKGKKVIDVEAYLARYYSPALRAGYTPQQESFYLGYYCHLLTDLLWSDRIAWPTEQKFPDVSWEEMKKDWYDQDQLFLRKNPDFRAYRIYLGSVNFENRYIEFFTPDAFEIRRKAVTEFYRTETADPDRKYPYLTEEGWNRFTEDCANTIYEVLK